MVDDNTCIPCPCDDPECEAGYFLKDMGTHPFLVPHQRSWSELIADPTDDTRGLPYATVRFSSWDIEWERTDVHDLLALLWAGYLRVRGFANASLISEPGFASENEISARSIIPTELGSSFQHAPTDTLRVILGQTSMDVRPIYDMLRSSVDVGDRFSSRGTFDEPGWMQGIRTLFPILEDGSFELQTRLDGPIWTCLSHAQSGLTIAELPSQSIAYLRAAFGLHGISRFDTATCRAFKDENLRNAVDHRTLELISDALELIDGQSCRPTIVPMASHVLGIGRRSIIGIGGDFGYRAFGAEVARLEQRRQDESEFFKSDYECKWASNIADDRFEAMVAELIRAERGVIWLRQVGGTREADDGRDFVAEWIRPPGTSFYSGIGSETGNDGSAPEMEKSRRVVVQVKLRSRGVSRSDISGIRDTVEHHDGSGFLLVAFPNVTSTLHQHLEKLRYRSAWSVDWWNRSDIELRLRRNSDVAARYPDVVALESPY